MALPESLRARLDDWARAAYPYESCGLLLGEHDSERIHVRQILLARNLNAERAEDRYELDPLSFLEADELARVRGIDIVGVWHTHPDHPARPSETDRTAAWEGWSYLIISVGAEAIDDMRSWRLRGERFDEEPVIP